VTCVVRLTPERVPPSVKFPDVVTVPVSVIPLTVPVPPTDVTVPLLLTAEVHVVPLLVKTFPEVPGAGIESAVLPLL
jgi:hypothetical protein